MPDSSVLGPMLFNIFKNELERRWERQDSKFPDDTKLLRLGKTRDDCEERTTDRPKQAG